MPMSKIKDIKLETTATYQPLSDLNVRFWNQDKDTAVLQFNITRNDYPLGLSEENVKVFIALESGDSFLVDDNLDYVDELNGVVAYTIPNEFMRVATSVKGQVYVTTLDEEEVVVQRQFTFTVANDLIADLPAEDKIREIKYFSDMRADVAQMMEKLNNDFANMNDYVTQVEQTTQDGITALTNLIKQKQDAYNANHTAKMKELNDKGTEYSTKFDSDKDYIDEKTEEFKDAVNGSGLITTGQSKDWQKYKLTDDDGNRPYLTKGSFQDVNELPVGLYETVAANDATTQNLPPECSNAFIEIDVNMSNGGRKQIYVLINYSKRLFLKVIHTNNDDRGWVEFATINTENPFETLTGSQNKANTAENNAKQYTDEKYNRRNSVLFEGNANGVGTPINLNETLDNFIVLYIYGDFPGGEFVALGNPQGTRNINLNLDNIVGLDATVTSTYECSLTKVNKQQLQINSDNFMNVTNGTSSGANANRFTIQKIVGVYK